MDEKFIFELSKEQVFSLNYFLDKQISILLYLVKSTQDPLFIEEADIRLSNLRQLSKIFSSYGDKDL